MTETHPLTGICNSHNATRLDGANRSRAEPVLDVLEADLHRPSISESRRPVKVHILLSFTLVAALLIGCGGGDSATESSVSAADRAEAADVYTSRCVTCHGTTGKGDGPGSAGLEPAPRDLSQAEWQKSVTDEHIELIILYGGAGVQMSPVMPPNPDLNSKPGVVTALRIMVRELEGK